MKQAKLKYHAVGNVSPSSEAICIEGCIEETRQSLTKHMNVYNYNNVYLHRIFTTHDDMN